MIVIGLTTNTSVAQANDLDELVALALTENPELDTIASETVALEERIEQAGAWRDPTVTLSYLNVPLEKPLLGQVPMSMVRIQVGQQIPYFGKTDKRRDVVRQAITVKQWEVAERRLELRAQVERAYYELGLTRQLRKLTEEHITLVEQLIDVVRIKYEVGKAQQQELLRLELLRDRLRDDLHEFDRRQTQLLAALNTTLHRDVATPVSTPATFELPAPVQSVAALRGSADKDHPTLARLDAMASMHRLSADLAEAEAVPDPTFFAAYGIRTDLPNGVPGTDLVTVGVSVPIPASYGSTYGARARESRLLAEAAESRRAAVLDRLGNGLADSMASWMRGAQKVSAYRDKLVPAAHATLDATFSNYQVGRADFVSLFEAQLELLNFEKAIHVAVVDGLIARVNIEMLVGKELP